MQIIKLVTLVVVCELVLIGVFGGSYKLAEYWSIRDVAAQKANHHAHRQVLNHMPED